MRKLLIMIQEFETGSMSYAGNDLILFAENTYELANKLQDIYRVTPIQDLHLVIKSEYLPLAMKSYGCLNEPEKITIADQDNIVKLLATAYYEDFRIDNPDFIPPAISDIVIQTLQNCQVEGKIVKLPLGQLERQDYMEVKKKLELIGGKWKGGKVTGFVFEEDPTELLNQIANGGNRNLKKEFQFFGTPDALADRLVDLAELREGHYILEPSAGQGAIIKAINRHIRGEEIFCFELMPLNQIFLRKLSYVVILGEDFLLSKHNKQFDRIIANPPFSKNQDVDHILKMYEVLKPGGRIVSIAGKHWQYSSNKKEKAFRDWLDKVEAKIIEIEAGEFKESGTSVATVIIVINKKAA